MIKSPLTSVLKQNIILDCWSTHLPIPYIHLGAIVHQLGAVGYGLTPLENGSVQKPLIRINQKWHLFQFAKTNQLETHMRSYLSLRERLFNYQDPLILIRILVILIVQFPMKGYKIRLNFGQKSRHYKEIVVHISQIHIAF